MASYRSYKLADLFPTLGLPVVWPTARSATPGSCADLGLARRRPTGPAFRAIARVYGGVDRSPIIIAYAGHDRTVERKICAIKCYSE